MQEVDAFGRDREPGRLDIEQLPYVQACFKVCISRALAALPSVQAACTGLVSSPAQKQCLQSQRLSSCQSLSAHVGAILDRASEGKDSMMTAAQPLNVMWGAL